MEDLRDKRVTVVGLGKSGLAAAELCLSRGAKVTLNDSKDSVAGLEPLLARGAVSALGGHSGKGIEESDLVVLSPGVPPFPELDAAQRRGAEIVSEVELAVRCLSHPAPIVAVGGTNGKSTVTTLIGELLAEGGRSVFTGGNLGEPLSAHVDETFDFVVLEVSSFQMERVSRFCPRVSLLLNVTPDHLDRYPSFDAYADAKGNAFVAQGPADLAVVPFGDEVCLAQARRGRGRIKTFGADPRADVLVTDAVVLERSLGAAYPRSDIRLAGGHNALNVAAALAAVVDLGVSEGDVKRVLARFSGLEHRTALVAEVDGVRYYDDSKGTNVGASVTAILGLAEPKAVVLLGGKDKGGSYAPLVAALREKARAAVVFGEAAQLIAGAIGDAVPFEVATDMADAVRRARSLAKPGDAVLLSPACSSFDMFKDYKERGDVFAACVRNLEGKGGSS
ncbi:MAG: UDP-N-acetylmuramoyl-L-alanine--D-glutamate ligase [Polyangiaceae bacterium]